MRLLQSVKNKIIEYKNWVIAGISSILITLGFISFYPFGALPEFDIIANQIIDSQNIYFQENGHYWQGYELLNHLPKDGEKLPPSQKDFPEKSWSHFINLPTSISFNIRVNRYESTKGHGWNAIFQKEIAGEILQKGIGHGPNRIEDTYDWKIVKKLIGTASTTP